MRGRKILTVAFALTCPTRSRASPRSLVSSLPFQRLLLSSPSMPAMTMPFLPRDFFDPSGGYTERDAASPLAARLIIGRDAALGAIDDAESRMDKFALACVRDKDRPPSLELLGVFAQRSEQVLTARSSLRLLRRLLFKNTCVLEEAHHRWVSEMSIQMVITSKELTSWSILDLDASLSYARIGALAGACMLPVVKTFSVPKPMMLSKERLRQAKKEQLKDLAARREVVKQLVQKVKTPGV